MGSRTPLTARTTLGTALRSFREARGLLIKAAAEELGVADSTLSRVERGQRSCPPNLFANAMNYYEVSDDVREELAELLADSKADKPAPWAPYREYISANYERFLGFELPAKSSKEYQALMVPAMAQTEPYARAVTSVGFASLGPDQVDELVDVRMMRQRYKLAGSSKMTCTYIITQAALEFRVGGQTVHRHQLQHLLEISDAETVDLRVIPYERGEEGTQTGAYTIFEYAEDHTPPVAFAESVAGTIMLDDARDLRRLQRLHQNLTEAALSQQATRDLIMQIMTKEAI